MKRVLCVLLAIYILIQPICIFAEGATSDSKVFDPADLKSEAVILVETGSGEILYSKNENKKMYPASMTKIMTALLAVENLDMKEVITVGSEINLMELDASSAGLRRGEQMTNEDLLRALLIPSGNDAAYTVAVQVARKVTGDSSLSIEKALDYFYEMMNKRAKEIGAVNSNFVNPHGYHDDNHYTTAYDQYIIAREAMKHEVFRNIVKTRSYSTEESSGADGGESIKRLPHQWYNRNLMLNKNSKYYYELATGIKTGYTSDSGYCLVSSASNGNLNVIAVVMNAPTDEARWEDSKNLLKYGLENFEFHTVLKKEQAVTNVKVGKRFRSKTEDIAVVSDKEYTSVFNKNDIPNIKENIVWNEELIDKKYEEKHGSVRLLGPVTKGQVLGKVIYTLNDKTIVESDLLAIKDAMELDVFDHVLNAGYFVASHWKVFAISIIALAALIVILRVAALRKRKKKSQWSYRNY
ncbi:MAG TPA: D-alanyl-D-alanine carboxypeptidase [Clostridiaceae bacterium]|nr:D-alanyl-D-alanine carboxypeptidase [Clostridiaceae bacterium]